MLVEDVTTSLIEFNGRGLGSWEGIQSICLDRCNPWCERKGLFASGRHRLICDLTSSNSYVECLYHTPWYHKQLHYICFQHCWHEWAGGLTHGPLDSDGGLEPVALVEIMDVSSLSAFDKPLITESRWSSRSLNLSLSIVVWLLWLLMRKRRGANAWATRSDNCAVSFFSSIAWRSRRTGIRVHVFGRMPWFPLSNFRHFSQQTFLISICYCHFLINGWIKHSIPFLSICLDLHEVDGPKFHNFL